MPLTMKSQKIIKNNTSVNNNELVVIDSLSIVDDCYIQEIQYDCVQSLGNGIFDMRFHIGNNKNNKILTIGLSDNNNIPWRNLRDKRCDLAK